VVAAALAWAGAAAAALVCAGAVAAGAPTPNLRVRDHRLVDGGHTVQLRGVNRSGLEYACIQGYGFFDSPHPDRIDDPAMIAAMKSWDINAVRVPLNEDCWLGVNAPRPFSGTAYRRIVRRYVAALNAAGLYVILDLHWAAPGRMPATNQIPMADRDHAPAFWRSVARTFSSDHALVFDLFNEPYGISWKCWRDGCVVPASGGRPAYRAAGMQQLIDAVRSTGARQPLMLGGIQWSLDLSGWLAHEPGDPLHALVASEHDYGGLSPCSSACRGAIINTRRRVPVVLGELGETDCRHGYIDQMMRFADDHGISYLGWAWDAVSPGGWSCSGGPSLITSYRGTPTGYGVGFEDHFRALGVPYRPSLGPH
jgi:endoglucanase